MGFPPVACFSLRFRLSLSLSLVCSLPAFLLLISAGVQRAKVLEPWANCCGNHRCWVVFPGGKRRPMVVQFHATPFIRASLPKEILILYAAARRLNIADAGHRGRFTAWRGIVSPMRSPPNDLA